MALWRNSLLMITTMLATRRAHNIPKINSNRWLWECAAALLSACNKETQTSSTWTWKVYSHFKLQGMFALKNNPIRPDVLYGCDCFHDWFLISDTLLFFSVLIVTVSVRSLIIQNRSFIDFIVLKTLKTILKNQEYFTIWCTKYLWKCKTVNKNWIRNTLDRWCTLYLLTSNKLT